MLRMVRLCLLLVLAATTFGCARDRRPLASVATVPQGEYAQAFDAARDELRRLGFSLDRIDARAGVITTHPQTSAGLATPWEKQETLSRQEVDNLLHRQRRRVEVSFHPQTQDGQAAPPDLREWEGPIVVSVDVMVDRIYRFGIRPSTVSIRLSSVTNDPALTDAGVGSGLAVAHKEDDWLAGRIASRIQAQLAVAP